MNQYLLIYRFSYLSMDEVLEVLKTSFPDVTLFEGAEAFLVKTPLSQEELVHWIDQELSYSIKSFSPAKTEA